VVGPTRLVQAKPLEEDRVRERDQQAARGLQEAERGQSDRGRDQVEDHNVHPFPAICDPKRTNNLQPEIQSHSDVRIDTSQAPSRSERYEDTSTRPIYSFFDYHLRDWCARLLSRYYRGMLQTN
jgi:hypothetical protein